MAFLFFILKHQQCWALHNEGKEFKRDGNFPSGRIEVHFLPVRAAVRLALLTLQLTARNNQRYVKGNSNPQEI